VNVTQALLELRDLGVNRIFVNVRGQYHGSYDPPLDFYERLPTGSPLRVFAALCTVGNEVATAYPDRLPTWFNLSEPITS
jgi:hypothetical protein